MGNWFDKSNRGFLIGVWSGNSNIGNIIGYQIGYLAIDYFKWGWQYAMALAAAVTTGP